MQSIRMWISWTQRPGSRVPITHLQNLHNTSIALRYGAIITVLKKPLEQLELFQKRILKQIITDELSGPNRLYTNWNSTNRSTNSYKSPHSSITSVIRAEKKHRKSLQEDN